MRSGAEVSVSRGADNEQRNVTYRLLEPSDEVVAVLLLLETSERHLCARNVLEHGKHASAPNIWMT